MNLISNQQAGQLLAGSTPGPWKYDGICYIFGPDNEMVADDGGPDETSVRIRGAGANLPMDKNAALLASAPSLAQTVISLWGQVEIMDENVRRHLAIALNKLFAADGAGNAYFVGQADMASAVLTAFDAITKHKEGNDV